MRARPRKWGCPLAEHLGRRRASGNSHENLYGISFNSTHFVEALQKVEGAATARTVATDGLTPSSARLLPKAFPAAELVDGEPLLRRVRQVKLAAEVDAIRSSVRIAEASLADAVAALRPGITERQLTGIFMGAMADAGVTTPASQDAAWITSREQPWQRAGRDEPVAPGDLVVFDAGVVFGGYVGELGRTHLVGDGDLEDEPFRAQWWGLWDRLLESCQVGAPFAGLLEAYDRAGVPLPPVPVARGLGLGFDLPLVSRELPGTAAEGVVEAGMVFVLTASVWKEGRGTLAVQEPVYMSATGPELLSTTPLLEKKEPLR